MELTRLGERTFYVAGPANVGGVILENGRVALIDSGIDEKYATRLFELLSDYRFKVAYILNTHAHADHIGGNNFFATRCNCRIFAAKLEAPTIRQPLIQSAVLFAGSPIQDLMNRFIIADPSPVEVFPGDQFELDGVNIRLLDLPGHSVNQKGFLIDDVAFVADTLFPEAFFKKQRLPFSYDPQMHTQTLEKMRTLSAKTFVGGHFPATGNIATLIASNLQHVDRAMSFMRELLRVPQSQDHVVKAFLDHFGMKKVGWEYYLYRATVNGYLSSLYRRGEVKYRVLDNLAVWYAV